MRIVGSNLKGNFVTISQLWMLKVIRAGCHFYPTYFEIKRKLATLVIALIWTDDHFEVQQVIRIGKARCAGARKIKFIDVY